MSSFIAAVFRYNVVSLVNILLFFVSVLIPGPNLKSQKGEVLRFNMLHVFMSHAPEFCIIL